MLRITGIKISLSQKELNLESMILKKLKITKDQLIGYTIYKQSIDARKKQEICLIYTVDVSVKKEKQVLQSLRDSNISISPKTNYTYVNKGEKKLKYSPVIIGTGPSGLFAGLILAQMGYRPIILERGKDILERSKDVEQFWKEGTLNEESNVQFGEGGAGTFSDGKLTTQIKDTIRCKKVLEELVNAGAPSEIMYKSKAHVGTDLLKGVVQQIRKNIISLGGQVRFNSKVTEILIKDNRICGVRINGIGEIQTQTVVLAIGHSARDTFEMLYEKGVEIHQKPFAIGVRIEHPQNMIDNTQYGNFAQHHLLGAADYKLAYHCENGRSVYTFCMCPGGMVVAAASEMGRLVTNGMSEYARDQINANSALLVGVGTKDFESDHPLAGMYFQRIWEEKAFELGGGNYHAPAQLVRDFLADKPTENLGAVIPAYKPGVFLTDLRKCLPDYVVEAMKEGIVGLEKQLKGFSMGDAIMTAIETRSSSPIRIKRDEGLQSNIRGLYPTGEGAGYAGGIISAAVDGVKVAEAIASAYSF